MSLSIPLTVRLSTARADRHIERDVRSLRFRSVAPGGFASAQFALDRPLASSPDEIAYYGSVYVYDARNGQTVWEGRIEDPGRGAGSDGQIWDLAAVGPSAHARDRVAPLIYVDRSLEGWTRSWLTWKATDLRPGDRDNDVPSLIAELKVNSAGNGSAQLGATGDWQYTRIYESGMQVGRIQCLVVDGVTSANVEHRLLSRIAPTGGGTTRDNDLLSTTQTTLLGRRGVEWTTAEDVVNLRIQRTAAASTGADFWSEFWGIIVRSVTKDASGNDITSAYNNSGIFAFEVVNDLLGRLLPKYDGPNASVDTSGSYMTQQLTFVDGATPAQVLERLMELEPAFYWAAWETGPTDLHRFEWRPWPTHVRYEADAVDGFNSPGSAHELYNQVLARWLSPHGYRRTTISNSDVPQLTAADLTRTGLVELDDQIGMTTPQAVQAGEQFLDDHATPPNAGTLTIARPIYDHDRGTSIMPWEIRPGHLLRVRGVRPNVNSLNATARDGVTVFRVVGVDYDTASASATLELDSHPHTVARALATLDRTVRVRR